MILLSLRRTWKIRLLGVSVLAIATPSWAGSRPKIESVDGAKTVLLQRGLELRDAAIGEEIHPGERVRTDEKTKVVIAYPDGSHLTIRPGSDLEIESPQNQVQSSLLRSGQVVGAVNKELGGKELTAEEKAGGKEAPPKKIHFVIRTKTAVMGVRGTEFVAAFNPASGLAQFNTLEGTVEVASNPASLLGGQGVPVGGGHFVQATSNGIGAVQSFNPVGFLSSLNSVASAISTGTSGISSVASALGKKSSGSSSGSAPGVTPPAPRLPEAPKGIEPNLAVVEAKKEEDERQKPTWHLLAFSLGAFYSANPQGDSGGQPYRAVSVFWTPSIPVPVLHFLVVRGSFGVHAFANGSINNQLLIREFQAFLAFTLLRPLYVEAGGGEQLWAAEQLDAGVYSVNVGLILSENGRWNRVFVGTSTYQGDGTHKAQQLNVGVGFQF